MTRLIPVSSGPSIASVTPSARRASDRDARRRPRHNLPVQLTNFIGREREIAELLRLVAVHPPADADGRRRVRQDAPGAGAGGDSCSIVFPTASGSSIWRPLTDPSLVTQTVASVLDVREGPNRPIREALVGLRPQPAVLLVLDNCEHLIAACAQLAEALLRAAVAAAHPGHEPRGTGHHRRNDLARAVSLAARNRCRQRPPRRCASTTRCACSSSAPPPSTLRSR